MYPVTVKKYRWCWWFTHVDFCWWNGRCSSVGHCCFKQWQLEKSVPQVMLILLTQHQIFASEWYRGQRYYCYWQI